MTIVIPNLGSSLKGNPARFHNLVIFPLIEENGRQPDYLTLDGALAAKSARITEVSEGGSVPQLRFVNQGDKRVLLLDGEEVIGAKQNRVFNVSILAPAGKTIILPVSCVESGRWHHTSAEFSSAPRTMYAEGRAAKMAQVSESMKASGRKASDQSGVWNSIAAKFNVLGGSSETSAMSDMYEQQSTRLENYVRSFSPLPNQVGAVFALDGKVIGLELFDSAETFRKLFQKLVRSYGLDPFRPEVGKPMRDRYPPGRRFSIS